jgi:hypothetical protein
MGIYLIIHKRNECGFLLNSLLSTESDIRSLPYINTRSNYSRRSDGDNVR